MYFTALLTSASRTSDPSSISPFSPFSSIISGKQLPYLLAPSLHYFLHIHYHCSVFLFYRSLGPPISGMLICSAQFLYFFVLLVQPLFSSVTAFSVKFYILNTILHLISSFKAPPLASPLSSMLFSFSVCILE